MTSADGEGTGIVSAGKPEGFGPWKKPLTAAAITLAAMLLILAAFLAFYPKGPGFSLPGPKALGQRIATGKSLLAEGQFHEAVRVLKEALDLRERYPEFLSPAERKQLAQLHRQASLLVDLLSQSLEDILFQAAAEGNDAEWQSLFAERYHGKAVVFFAEVRRDAQGNYRLNYEFLLREKPVSVELGNLQLLHDLPLGRPQRLLFGARLASVGLEPGGNWVIRFEPDSGVLLTDPGAVAAFYSRPLDGLDEVLQRQAAWVAEMP